MRYRSKEEYVNNIKKFIGTVVIVKSREGAPDREGLIVGVSTKYNSSWAVVLDSATVKGVTIEDIHDELVIDKSTGKNLIYIP